MALGLMPGARTQGISWSCQEVHHCATSVMIENCPYIYGLNTNPVKARGRTCPLRLILPFVFVDTHSSDVFFSVPHSTIDVETSFRLVASLVVNLTYVHNRSHYSQFLKLR